MISYVISKNFISVVVDNVPYNINESHHNFELIKTKLKDKDYENLVDLMNEKESLSKSFVGIDDLTIYGNTIFYKGEPIHNSLVTQILETKNQGYEYTNLLKFLENLMSNTDEEIREELYDWINSSGCISITNDGAFLAYKKVNKDYTDIYSGTFDNSIGKFCFVDKDSVERNRNKVCSFGLHFCSYDYLAHYGSNTDGVRVVIVKIFPQDVISIPVDYNFQKGRCWKYEVVGEVEKWQTEEYLTKPVDDYSDEEILDANFIKWSKVDIFIETLSISEMTDFYNIFYKKSIKHLRTKLEAINAMWKIYKADDTFFDEFI